jgi:UDP-N-acetylglucosamine diphosphorylase / glucose-1-phosphate thymidylyltransferase / UDP-N-acetylgalactosamine diphosphorylase / glucosamine-1-phosphate N-acetyltransferase / galactosamine-1-phosphate N-acetyltransferase
MEYFYSKNFFNIEEFEYKELFEDKEPVWSVLLTLQKFFAKKSLGKILSNVPDSVVLENKEQIFIEKNVLIEPGCFIKGPCIIGNGSEIRFGAYIRGFVITGRETIIGHATEIKNSILLNKAKAAHFAYIGDSILGNNVNLGAGVKCSNFRLDKKEIKFSFKENIFVTGLKKFGAAIGDNVQVGCNTVLNPGTFIGKDSICYAGLNFGGVIPKNSIVKSSSAVKCKAATQRVLFNAVKQ